MVDNVEARSFVLVDAAGRKRACLATDVDGSPSLQFYEIDGKLRLQAGLKHGRASILLVTKAGSIALYLGTDEDDTSIRLSDAAGVTRVVIYAAEDGTASFELCEGERKMPIMIRLEPDGTYTGSFEKPPKALNCDRS